MSRFGGLFSLWLLIVAGSCLADEQAELLQGLVSRLSPVEALAGAFYQEKHVSFLQNPFVSKGRFSLSRGEGLSWHVSEPLDSTMRVHGDEVTLDGKPVNDYGVAQLMTSLMFAFMEGDFADLERTFEISGALQEAEWRVTLVPMEARLKAAFERVDLRGDQHLREVTVFEAGGNRTNVQFVDVVAKGQAAPPPGAIESDGIDD